MKEYLVAGHFTIQGSILVRTDSLAEAERELREKLHAVSIASCDEKVYTMAANVDMDSWELLDEEEREA